MSNKKKIISDLGGGLIFLSKVKMFVEKAVPIKMNSMENTKSRFKILKAYISEKNMQNTTKRMTPGAMKQKIFLLTNIGSNEKSFSIKESKSNFLMRKNIKIKAKINIPAPREAKAC